MGTALESKTNNDKNLRSFSNKVTNKLIKIMLSTLMMIAIILFIMSFTSCNKEEILPKDMKATNSLGVRVIEGPSLCKIGKDIFQIIKF